MGLRKVLKSGYFSMIQSLTNSKSLKLELSKINASPRSKPGTTNIFGKPFKFHDGPSFVATYKELFESHIYRFSPTKNARTILDCGANMGLSVLYFSQNYPQHHIIAFEPDPEIFAIMKENVETFGLNNITLHQKAVWHTTETLTFFADGKMGGRIEGAHKRGREVKIEAVALSEFLTEDVDFLKIDIEGAEVAVLRGSKDILHKAKHIFFEYHNSISGPQTLHELMQIVSEQGFTYYIKESDVRKRPFLDKHVIADVFDMALNVFCYREEKS